MGEPPMGPFQHRYLVTAALSVAPAVAAWGIARENDAPRFFVGTERKIRELYGRECGINMRIDSRASAAVLGILIATLLWAGWHSPSDRSCPPPSPQSVETLFAPCQATDVRQENRG